LISVTFILNHIILIIRIFNWEVENMMNKKGISIFVVSVFILSVFGASAGSILDINDNICLGEKDISNVSREDELDQYQNNMTENIGVLIGQIPIPENPINIQAAQSFIPTKDMIIRAELFIGKNITASSPLIVSIRSELIEDDLTSAIIEPDQVPTQELDWVEIDFDDIFLTAGQTYYIVALTENITDNFYGWGANNNSESYPHGCAWFSINDGLNWTNESAASNSQSVESFIYKHDKPLFDDHVTWDMCFRTYGFENQPPSTPTITGPNSGKPGTSYTYTFTTGLDPDGDEVSYYIEWGDNSTSGWTGFIPSGPPGYTESHSWSLEDTYVIRCKAKDEFDAESDWGELTVKIPRDKSINLPLQGLYKFLQSYPNLLSIFQHILNL
jgi:hypothetical protein